MKIQKIEFSQRFEKDLKKAPQKIKKAFRVKKEIGVTLLPVRSGIGIFFAIHTQKCHKRELTCLTPVLGRINLRLSSL